VTHYKKALLMALCEENTTSLTTDWDVVTCPQCLRLLMESQLEALREEYQKEIQDIRGQLGSLMVMLSTVMAHSEEHFGIFSLSTYETVPLFGSTVYKSEAIEYSPLGTTLTSKHVLDPSKPFENYRIRVNGDSFWIEHNQPSVNEETVADESPPSRWEHL